MDIGNKILTVYSARYTPDNSKIKAGDIWLQNGQNPYKIYDGSEWQTQTGTKSSELKEIFSEDENYFYVNYNANPNIEFVKKYTNNGWEDITNSRTGQLLKIAADVEAVADGKISTYSGDFSNERAAIAPNPDEGDLFIDTANQNKLYRYSYIEGTGFNWVAADDERLVGEGSGINFVPTGATSGSIILNKANGLKITNNNGAYFQATHNKMGFYTSNGTALMQISGGNAYFSGSISASTISASSINGANFTNSNGSKLSFGNQTGFYQSGGEMHVDNLTIDGNCIIGGTLSAVTGTFGGTNDLGISAEITNQGVLRFVSKNAPVSGTSQYQYETYIGGGDSVYYGSPIWVQYQSQSDMTNYGLARFSYSYSGGHYFINLDIRNGWGQNYSSEGYSGVGNNIFRIYNGEITVANFSDAVYADIASHIGGGGSGGTYVLPTASSSTKGGIKVGNGLYMSGDSLNVTTIASVSDMQYSSNTGTYIGKINGTNIYVPSGGSSYTLPTASSSTKGGIKVGSGLAMSGETLYVTSVPTTSVHVESGEVTFTGESSKITFNSPFSTLPIITVSRAGTRSNLEGVTFSVVSRTDYISGGMYTGFKIKSSSTTLSTTVDWIAVG